MPIAAPIVELACPHATTRSRLHAVDIRMCLAAALRALPPCGRKSKKRTLGSGEEASTKMSFHFSSLCHRPQRYVGEFQSVTQSSPAIAMLAVQAAAAATSACAMLLHMPGRGE